MEEFHLEIKSQWICLILRSAIGSSHWNVPPPTDNEHPMLVLGNPPTPTVNVRALVMHLTVMMIPQCFLNKHRLIIETNNPRHFPRFVGYEIATFASNHQHPHVLMTLIS